MLKKSIAAAALALSLSATAAIAVPLSYDEAVDGDIDNSPDSSAEFGVNRPVLTFGYGVNTITGTVSGRDSNISGDRADFDIFDALLPTGAIVGTISLTQTNNPDGNDDFPTLFGVRDASDGLVLFSTSSFDSSNNTFPSNGSFFSTDLGMTADGDILRQIGHNGLRDDMVVDYTIEITLIDPAAVVPLPAAAPLLLSGLLGLAWLPRRRARTA